MKPILGIATLIFVAIVGWRIGGSLSSDALGMAVGMLFGVMAGIPTALLLLASQRQSSSQDDRKEEREHRRKLELIEAQRNNNPIIVVANGALPNQGYQQQAIQDIGYSNARQIEIEPPTRQIQPVRQIEEKSSRWQDLPYPTE